MASLRRARSVLAASALAAAASAATVPSLGSQPPALAPVVFKNLSSIPRSEWGRATVPFPQGVWTPGKAFGAVGLPSEMIPFGAAWPDGSVRYAQLSVPLGLGPGQELSVQIGSQPLAPPPFQASSWVAKALPSFDVKILATLPSGAVQIAGLNLVKTVHSSAARQTLLFRGRIPATDLSYELWLDFWAGQDHVPFELRSFCSNAQSQRWYEDVTSLDLLVNGALVLVRGASRRGVTASALPGTAATLVQLLGPERLWDGQGQEWWGDLLFFAPDGSPGDPQRTSTLLAVLEHPIVGISTGWRSSGAFGPFGYVPPDPPWITDGGRAAANAARLAYDAWIAGTGYPWEDMPLGLLPQASTTGDQYDFGAAKLLAIFASGLPDGIEEARMNASEEAHRPCHHREGDGGPVLSIAHPRWVALDGRTHFNTTVSPDRLGKTSPDPVYMANGWSTRDHEHWSSLTLASAYLLTGSHALRAELDNEAELYLASHTIPSTKPGWSTNAIGQPRAVGRTFLSMAWNWLCTGRDDLRGRMAQRASQCVLPQATGLNVTGPVKPVNYSPPDARVIPNYEFWKPWEDALAILGLEACYQVTGEVRAHIVAYVAASSLLSYGWKIDQTGVVIGTGITWKSDGTPLTWAEYQDPNKVLWSYGTGFSEWALSSTKLALRYGLTYGDAKLTALSSYVLQQLAAARTPPKGGGYDRYSEWDAVR